MSDNKANHLKMDTLKYFSFIWAAAVILFPEVLAEERNEGKSTKMITGIAAGFAFILGLVIVIVTMWCCCCSKLTEKRRVMPSEIATRSTSADTRRSSNSSKT